MSRIEKMINELCPDGVEYKRLGDLGTFKGGITGKTKNDFKDGNAVFISYKNVYENPAVDINPEDRVKIKQDENQRTLQYGDVIFTGSSETPDECGISSVVTEEPTGDLYLNSFCFFFRFNDNNIMLPDFSKHLFRSGELRHQIGRTASGVTRFNVSKEKMKKVTIPVPPLEVQREIVRILDQFTEKTNELKAALDAELTARKKQYEWYRRKLLSSIETLEVYCLKDLAIIKTGSKPNHIEDEPHDGMYEYINAGTTRSGYVTDCNCSGDTVTTPSRGQGGIGFVGYQQDPFWLGPLCYRITAKDNTQLSNEYLYYSLSNQTEDILSRKKEGGVPALNASDLGTIRIPLPELNVQKRIVDSLNRFKALCNDISEGLPAEIEARQKQHEYYRDKLLTFKEKTA